MPKIRDFDRVTALYERLFKDDEQQGESNSILNQKRFLEDFARKTKAERWAANDGHKYPKRVCEQCGKEFYPNSTRQRFCNTACVTLQKL